jgi:peroxiredoxin
MRWMLVLCVPCLLFCNSCMMPDRAKQVAANEVYLKKEGLTALEAGHAAPDLGGAVDAATGEPAVLAALLDGHQLGIVLLFIPALDTPNSLHHLRELDKRRADLEAKGIGVAGVCPGNAEAVKVWAARHSLLLPLIADPVGQAAEAYGCLAAGASYPQRTTVGITAEKGIVLYYRGMAPVADIDKAFGLKDAKAESN